MSIVFNKARVEREQEMIKNNLERCRAMGLDTDSLQSKTTELQSNNRANERRRSRELKRLKKNKEEIDNLLSDF